MHAGTGRVISMTQEIHFKNSCVADLAWAVSSPPLLSASVNGCSWFSDDWYRQLYEELQDGLLRLDRDPQALQGLLAAQKDQRLGNYFETLWAYVLELSTRFDLIERNLQIHDGERTVGEMDFIVYDRHSGRYAHWELAIKFYLGLGNTVAHDAWHGPAKKDRLDLKLAHLQSRQTLLSRHPAAQAELAQRGITIEECGVILKGRLFYPWQQQGPEWYPAGVNPSHLRGAWLTRDQLGQVFAPDERFEPLIRSGWLANNPTQQDLRIFTADDLIGLVDKGPYRFPMQVNRLEASSGHEKLFIVDNYWPNEKNMT